jgi:hypothetical protein
MYGCAGLYVNHFATNPKRDKEVMMQNVRRFPIFEDTHVVSQIMRNVATELVMPNQRFSCDARVASPPNR